MKRNVVPWLPVLAPMALLLMHARLIYAPCDDAYIDLVYVRSLFEGKGLTYNGTLVQGYSSVLWPWVIALVHLLGATLPGAAELASLGAALLVISGTYALGLRLGLSRMHALLPGLALSLTGDFAFYAGNGLETTACAGAVLLAFAPVLDAKAEHALRATAARVASLLLVALVRPEGVLVAGIVLGWLAYRHRDVTATRTVALGLGGGGLAVLVALRTYYGAWLPATYHVKSGAGLANVHSGLSYLGLFARHYALALGLFTLALALRWQSVRHAAVPVLLLCAAWTAQVTVQGGDNLVGFRMFVALLPLVYITTVLAFRDSARVLALVVTLGVFGHLGWSYAFGTVVGSSWQVPVQQQAQAWRNSTVERRTTGLWLRDTFPPDTRLALGAAGITPFYARLPTIDMLGLNDPHIAMHGHKDRTLPYAHQAGDGAYVLDRQPGVILFSNPNFVSEREILGDPRLPRDYVRCAVPGVKQAWVRKSAVTAAHAGRKALACAPF